MRLFREFRLVYHIMPYYIEKKIKLKTQHKLTKNKKNILQSFVVTLVDMILYFCVFAKKEESVSIYEVNEG